MKLPIYAFIWDVQFFRSKFYGTHNGYIAVPHNHPWHGKHYNEINEMLPMYIHGGLTFSEYLTEENSPLKENDWKQIIPTRPEISKELLSSFNYWVIGFDTAHSNDTPETWNETAVKAETEKLYLMAKFAYVEYLKGN